MGFDWQPVAKLRNFYARNDRDFGNDDENIAFANPHLLHFGYASCPDCGEFITDNEGQRLTLTAFVNHSDKRRTCGDCGGQLWTLKRPGGPKNPDSIIHNAICKIPTIGPKTADKLLKEFGAETLGALLGDNVFEFINLMDEKGGLIFSDRQAKRMEVALAKQEFGFGQGGYQASEFIKRYLPDGFFGLLLVDLW